MKIDTIIEFEAEDTRHDVAENVGTLFIKAHVKGCYFPATRLEPREVPDVTLTITFDNGGETVTLPASAFGVGTIDEWENRALDAAMWRL